MSRRSVEGKRIWRERGDKLAAEITDRITDQITAESRQQMHSWAAAGRIPLWVRIKARLRGRRIDLPARVGAQ